MKLNDSILIFFCWLVCIISTIGSLFFSEVMEFPPCTLCWYQRIAMYPLSIIFFVGAFRKVEDVFFFSIPFVCIGWIISLYHNLLHFEIIPETASPCREGISCSTVYIELFDFLTIPMMSFIAFSLVGVGFILMKKKIFYEK